MKIKENNNFDFNNIKIFKKFNAYKNYQSILNILLNNVINIYNYFWEKNYKLYEINIFINFWNFNFNIVNLKFENFSKKLEDFIKEKLNSYIIKDHIISYSMIIKSLYLNKKKINLLNNSLVENNYVENQIFYTAKKTKVKLNNSIFKYAKLCNYENKLELDKIQKKKKTIVELEVEQGKQKTIKNFFKG